MESGPAIAPRYLRPIAFCELPLNGVVCHPAVLTPRGSCLLNRNAVAAPYTASMNESPSHDQATTLENLVRQAGNLYTLPRVAMQVLELTNSPKVDARQLKQCIENDPSLTIKILRVVNSSLLGLSREVSDLNQALALLGIKPLKLLVLGFSLPEKLFADVAGDILERYWQRTVTKAVAAREIGQTWLRRSGDEFFIAGLLQDLGLLVLLQQLGQPYAAFLRKSHELSAPLLDLERRTLGFDHTELTSRLLAQWCLPVELVEGVRCPGPSPQSPHDFSQAADSLRRVLLLAESMTELLADKQTARLPEVVGRCQRTCGVTEQDVHQLLEQLQEKVLLLADVLSLRVPGVKDYQQILQVAHRHLAAAAEDVAGDVCRQQHRQNREVQNLLSRGELDDLFETRSLANALRKASAAAFKSPAPAVAAHLNGAADRPADKVPEIAPSIAHATDPSVACSPPRSLAPASAESLAAKTLDGDWVAIQGRLAAAAARCRKERCPFCLMLVEINDFEELVFEWGTDRAHRALDFIDLACRRSVSPGSDVVLLSEGCLALVLLNCERGEAVQLGRRIQNLTRDLGQWFPGNRHLSLSMGVAAIALPPKNFDSQTLLDSASRCLFAARGSGGDSVKSIEIY